MIRVIDSVERLQNVLNSDIQTADAEEIILKLNINEYTEPVKRALVRCAEKYLEAGFVPQIKIQSNNLEYSIGDFENIVELDAELSEKGIETKFIDMSEEYSVDESLNAFLKCREYADYVNSTNASPFEKYLMIYRYLTTLVYKENEESPLKARQLISVMNSDDIVCVGYSKLLKYLCNAVGIECETQKQKVYTKGSSRVGVHQTNVVYIKDEKYGIDGYYYADSCWDSIKRNKEPFMRYNYALLPIEDVNHIKNKRFEFFPSTAALYSDKALEEMFLSKEARKEHSKKFGFEYKEKPLPEFFREANSTGSKLVEVSKKVKQMFIEAGVPSDYLSLKNRKSFPTCFYPEVFIALMSVEPPEIGMANLYIDAIKQTIGKEIGYDEDIAFTKYQYPYGYDDIYAEFDKFAEGDFNFNIWDIADYYESLDYLKEFDSFITAARKSSTPVSKEVFENAIINSLLLEGVEEKYAKSQAERAMQNSERRAEKIFDRLASNCFTTSMIERRRQKADEKL